MTKKEFIFLSLLIMTSLSGWFILTIYVFVAIISGDFTITINYYEGNAYYIFGVSLIILIVTIGILIHFIRWGDIEKDLKEEMKYYHVKTLSQLKKLKK